MSNTTYIACTPKPVAVPKICLIQYNCILGLKSKENYLVAYKDDSKEGVVLMPRSKKGITFGGWSFSGTSGNHIAGTLAIKERKRGMC